jgi:hypothetical protein
MRIKNIADRMADLKLIREKISTIKIINISLSIS